MSCPGVHHNPSVQARAAAQRQAQLLQNMPAAPKSSFEQLREQAYPTVIKAPPQMPSTADRRVAADAMWSLVVDPIIDARRQAKLSVLERELHAAMQEEQKAFAAVGAVAAGKWQERASLMPSASIPRVSEKLTSRSRYAAAYREGLAR